jgi:hypothetical protein
MALGHVVSAWPWFVRRSPALGRSARVRRSASPAADGGSARHAEMAQRELLNRCHSGGMESNGAQSDWDVYSWELIRDCEPTRFKPGDPWMLSESDLFQAANEKRGLVLGQLAELESALLELAARLYELDRGNQGHKLIIREIEKQSLGTLHAWVLAALKDRGWKDPHSLRMKTIDSVIKRRNDLAHAPLRIEGDGEVHGTDGNITWADGDIVLGGVAGQQGLHHALHDARAATVATVEILLDVEYRLAGHKAPSTTPSAESFTKHP